LSPERKSFKSIEGISLNSFSAMALVVYVLIFNLLYIHLNVSEKIQIFFKTEIELFSKMANYKPAVEQNINCFTW